MVDNYSCKHDHVVFSIAYTRIIHHFKLFHQELYIEIYCSFPIVGVPSSPSSSFTSKSSFRATRAFLSLLSLVQTIEATMPATAVAATKDHSSHVASLPVCHWFPIISSCPTLPLHHLSNHPLHSINVLVYKNPKLEYMTIFPSDPFFFSSPPPSSAAEILRAARFASILCSDAFHPPPLFTIICTITPTPTITATTTSHHCLTPLVPGDLETPIMLEIQRSGSMKRKRNSSILSIIQVNV